MKKHLRALALFALVAASSAAFAQSTTVAGQASSTTRLVVKYKDGVARPNTENVKQDRVKALSTRAQQPLTEVKEMASGALVVKLDQPVSLEQARILALRLAQDPEVAYAAPDVWVKPMSVPNDPWAASQWQSATLAQAFGSARFFEAWASSGTTRVTVAVIDTGYVSHSDVSPNEIAGYDFISDPAYAGDGTARDNDPSDVGDYCDAEGTDSSWHGLKVSSQIAAVANNAYGIAGAAARNATVLQIRALGRCGGWMSDVADGVTWAAGGNIAGAPLNGTPARVINLSLGSPAGTTCFAYMQDAIDYANANRAVVVASAGNEGVDGIGAPANCSGVIAVGAHTRSGDLANYSNRNESVTLTAPGGGSCQTQTGTCLSEPTVSAGNAGTRSPGGEQQAVYFAGTSAAAPHVSAAAALLLAVNGDLTPAQVRSTLVSTARPHASDSFCAANPTKCGAGMLDAQAALSTVSPPTLTLDTPTAPVIGSSLVTLRVAPTGGTAPYTFNWSQVSGPSVTLNNANTATASFTAPPTKGLPMVFQIRVTANNGMSTTDLVTVRVNNRATLLAPTQLEHAAGTPFSRVLAGTDADGDVVSFAVVQAPAGVVVQGDTLSWPSPTVGTHRIVLIATDGAMDGSGDSAQHELTLVVSSAGTGGSGGSGGSSGGGGGSMPLSGLLLLGLAALAGPALRRRKQ